MLLFLARLRSESFFQRLGSFLILLLVSSGIPCSQGWADTGLSNTAPAPLEITIDDPLPAQFDETIPASVANVSPVLLREAGFLNLDSILDRLPNITWSAGTSRPRFILIRGIGDLDQYAGSGLPAVTVISDGMNFSGLANALSLFDVRLATIERGPTGFFGGPSSLAGLVSFKSGANDPDSLNSDSSILETSFGTGGVRRIAGRSLFTDIFDTAKKDAAYISIERSHQDGFLRNAYLGRADTNHQDTGTFKAGYRAQSDGGARSDRFSMNAISRNNDDGYDAFTVDNTRTVRSDKPGADDLNVAGLSLDSTSFYNSNLRLDVDASILRAKSTYSYDGDWGNDDFWFPNLPYDYFSLTFRNRHLATFGTKLTYGNQQSTLVQFGVYTQRLTESTEQQDLAESIAYRSLDSDFSDKRYALHGAVSQMLSSDVRSWFATRLERQETALNSRQFADDANTSQSFSAPLFQAGLEYFTTPQTKTFFKAARGWRGGGFNVGAAIPVDKTSYSPEYLTELSVGLRHALQEPGSFIELSLFRAYRYEQQVRLALQTDPSDPLSFVYVTDNAARGDTLGLEASSHFKLASQLTFESSLALLNAEFSKFEGGRPELQNRETAISPTWRANLSARYQISTDYFARCGIVSTDRYYFDDANDAQSASVSLLNAAVGYESGPWSVSLWGQNLTDRRYPVRGFFFGNEPPDYTPKRYIQRGPPLSGGITVTYIF